MWEAIGWIGSAVIVFSMMQQRITRLRLINLVGCVIAVAYNAAMGVWPMVALNAALAVIQAYNLYVLWRDRHDSAAYSVVMASPSDPIVAYVVETHREGISQFHPGFSSADDAHLCFVVMKGDEVVGIVLARRDGTEAELIVDYVTETYRDFTPGEFVFASGEWSRNGISSVRSARGSSDYYSRVGFENTDGVWRKHLVGS